MKISIGNIVGLITIIVSINLYQSYLFVSGLLASYGLNSISIYITEDLLFSFSKINTKLFLLAFSGYMFALIFNAFIYKDLIVNRILNFILWVKTKEVNLKKEKGKKLLRLAFTILIIVFFLILFITLSSITEWIMFLIIFVIPFSLILLPKHNTILTIFQLGFTVIWLNLFALDSIASVRKNESLGKREQLSFTYLGKSFYTGNDTLLIFNGHNKMIITFDNNKKFMLIPTDQIQNLTYAR